MMFTSKSVLGTSAVGYILKKPIITIFEVLLSEEVPI